MTYSGARWRLDAACQDVPGDWWFPKVRSTVNPLVLRTCRECPVQRQCLLYALAHAEIWHGVWGGLTAGELDRSRRRILDGESPRVVVEDAQRIAPQRGERTVYDSGVPTPVPGEQNLARQRAALTTALHEAGLLITDASAVERAA